MENELIRHQIFLARYAGTTENKVKALIKKLFKETNRRLKEAKRNNQDFKVADLVTLRRDLIEINAGLEVPAVLEKSAMEITEYEVEFMEKVLVNNLVESAVITNTPPELLYSTISRNKVVLTATTGAKTIHTINSLVREYSDKIPRDITSVIQFGISNGASISEMTRRVNALEKGRTRAQTRGMVRTVTNHVTSQARRSVVEANKRFFDKEEYVATLDSRTTIICAQFDGRLFDLDSGPFPPLHYNCRSIRVPKLKSEFGLDSLTGERPAVSLNEDGTRNISVVSGNTKYEDWLKKQPEHFQNEVLGKEKADIFRRGKLPLSKFVDENYRELTIEELRKLEGVVAKPPKELKPKIIKSKPPKQEEIITSEKEYKKAITLKDVLTDIPSTPTKSGIYFRGINKKIENEILSGLNDSVVKYGGKLNSIGWQTRRRRSLGVAAHSGDYIQFQKTATMKLDKNADIDNERDKKRIQGLIERTLKNIDDPRRESLRERNIKKLEELQKIKRWSVTYDTKSRVKSVALHEGFHNVFFTHNMWNLWDDILKQNNVSYLDMLEVSEYGASKNSELFAEVGAAIELGIEIPENIKNAFETIIKLKVKK